MADMQQQRWADTILLAIGAAVLACAVVSPQAASASGSGRPLQPPGAPTSASVGSPAPATGSVLAVSTPVDAISSLPGKPASSWIRVVNNGERPVTVTVSLATLSVGDEGTVNVSGMPDPAWAQQVSIAEPTLTLQPQSWHEDPVTFHGSSSLKPDTYLIGFLVTPQAGSDAGVTGNNVRVVNQIGTFLQFDVPGPRQREIRIAGLRMPHFIIGSSVPIRLKLKNSGPSFALTWAETHVHLVGHLDQQHAYPGRYRLPSGRERTLTWQATVRGGIGPIRVKALAFYNRSDSEVAQVEASGTVWIIAPAYLEGSLLLLGMAVAFALLRARHRRRASGSPARRPRQDAVASPQLLMAHRSPVPKHSFGPKRAERTR
ncbi:MAG: hypothetical protein NVS1B16_08590 [Pseudarthrobacter sp.]